MFDLSIKIVVGLIIILVALFLIWLIAFMIHIVRDEIGMENRQTYSPKGIDVVVNRIAAAGLQVFAKTYQFFRRR